MIEKALQTRGWTTPSELAWLAEQAAPPVSLVIEVGSFHGRTARALADGGSARVVCVDRWQEFDGTPALGDEHLIAFRSNLRDHIAAGRVLPLRTHSSEWTGAARVILEEMAGRVDLVFIDGGHTEAQVRADIAAFLPLLHDTGILCGHDYGNPEYPGVARAVNAVLPKHQRGPDSLWWVRAAEARS